MVRERSLIVRYEILGKFFNISFANDKYSCHKMENLMQVVQMQISQKGKLSSEFSLQFQNLHKIQNILKKKRKPHTLSISKIIASERCDYLIV